MHTVLVLCRGSIAKRKKSQGPNYKLHENFYTRMVLEGFKLNP